MKKMVFALGMMALLAGCGNEAEKSSDDGGGKKESVEGIAANPAYKKGLALIGKSDCLTCHKVDEKVNGPSYRDVANKYAGLPDTIVSHLAGKIIKGGNGVWGETYMTPHPGVSEDDAKAMVEYILLLKK